MLKYGKSNPEEIVRQLWVYKLMHTYGYKADEINLEKSVYFGSTEGTKAADIIVYTDNTKQTPQIIIEVKKTKHKDGIEQLKSYLNAEGSPVGVWSNGSDSIILYRPYPNIFDPDVSSLDPKTWHETMSGQALMQELVKSKLLIHKIANGDKDNLFKDEDLAWKYFDELKFDVILANPPFAGEMKDKKMLAHYALARPADKAFSLEKESKHLLEQAKQQVEDLIEQAAGVA